MESVSAVTWSKELFCEYTEIESNEKKLSVERMILSHMGWYAYKLIYQAALSDDPDRGDVILGTMLAAREIPDSRKNHGSPGECAGGTDF